MRNANGTGPFRLERYEPDIRTVLKRNPRWWGWSDKRSGNVDEVVWLAIRSDATRLAALISGEVDMVLDPPIQDVARLKSEAALTAAAEAPTSASSTSPSTMARDELDGSDVKGRNPFKDMRVRQAVYHAINVDLIVQKVLRGQAVPTGALPLDAGRRLAAPSSTSGCPSTRRRRGRCSPRPAIRTASR